MKMNKYFYLAAAATLLMGCAKEQDQKVEEVSGKVYTIEAAVENPATRSIASLNGTTDLYEFAWAEDETIAVVPDDYDDPLSFNVVDTENGTFSYTAGEGEQYTGFSLAVSPEDALQEAIVDGGNVLYTIQYSGSYLQGQSNAIMVAGAPTEVSGNQKFQFKHVGALVRVTYNNVPAGTFAMVFSTDNNFITGTFEFDSATGVEAIADNITPTDNTEAWVMLKNPTTAVVETMDFYLPIPTGSYKTFQVRLVDKYGATINGTEQTFSASNPFTVSRADVVECPAITLAVSAVENFSSSKATTNKYDCNSSLSTSANRTDFDFKWTPEGAGTVFQNGIKLGSGTATGSVTSSDILSIIPEGENFTVKIYAAVWNNDGGELVVTYNDVAQQAAPANDAITSTGNEYSASDFVSPTEFVFTKVENATGLKIASSTKRILIDKVEVVPGGTVPVIETLTVTPDENNPETVPAEGGVLNFTVETANIDSWTVESNHEGFVATKTADGFTVTVAENETTATRSATITVAGGSKSVDVTINQAAAENPDVNSIDNPYTVEEALAIIEELDDNKKTEACYTQGTITEITEVNTTDYYNATYTISSGQNSLVVFRGKYLGNVDFTSEDQINVGDVVVVYGELLKYVKNNVTTPEIAKDNYIAKFAERAPYFTAALTGEAQITYAGGTKTIEIAANVPWTATANNGATLQIGSGTPAASVSGTEDATVTVTIPANENGEEYVISFSSSNENVTLPDDIQITQTAVPTITGISVEDYTATYSVSEDEYSFDGKVYALYSNDTRTEIPAGDYSISGTVDLSTEGEYELTVSYQTFDKVIVISVANIEYQSSSDNLASWTFTSNSYPSNNTNFAATSGICTESTFYLNGKGSTWNSSKGFAFTEVTDVTITIKAVKALKAGSALTLSMDTFYNKASNAPMKGFNITVKESDGTDAITGLSVSSWSLSNSSANKTVTYTIQNDVAAGSTVVFILTQTGKAGSGQGYINNIKATYSAAE